MRYKEGSDENSEAHSAYEEYRENLYRYVYRIVSNRADAEDIMGGIYIRVITKWKNLKDVRATRNWIFTIARHLAFDKLKQRTLISLDDVNPIGVGGLEAKTVMRITVRQTLNGLQQDYRDPLILCDMDDRPAKEAAKILGLTVPALKSRLYRGRIALRDKLESALIT